MKGRGSRKPGPLLFSAETIKLVERAVPGSSSLDQKVRKLVDTNKKMRKDYEEMEQSIYSQRISRANHQANIAGHGPADEVNSKFTQPLLPQACTSKLLGSLAAKVRRNRRTTC
ncbi:hypothetical protein ANCDUO_15660 [Ancylostoma duodenale]|uniref:Uncharacterized protein n=1 Tax=Ancylostoma duodenale TaxID=51022 RepID=A0A0C2G5L6_9BILA|nr:hypothetical protein ANCDUO_15660 [Ancylostoma duodenale]